MQRVMLWHCTRGINNFVLALESGQQLLLLAGVAGAVCTLVTAEVLSRLVISR